MCNDYRLLVDAASIAEDFADLKITIRFSEGVPNLEAREDIRITDPAPIVRTIDGVRGEGDLVQRRWSWPERNGRPVYNFRSDGREFASNRCLIVADGFYEFTEPKDPKKKRKDKWLFTRRDEPVFCIAGIWRDTAGRGRGLHHADHAARAGYRSLPRPAGRHPRSRGVGGLAGPVRTRRVADQGAPRRDAPRRAGGLTNEGEGAPTSRSWLPRPCGSGGCHSSCLPRSFSASSLKASGTERLRSSTTVA